MKPALVKPLEKRRLVDVLAGMGVPRKLLTEAADEYYEIQFGKWLVSQGVISQEQLHFALAQQSYETGDFDAAQSHLLELSKSTHQEFSSKLEEASKAFQELPAMIASVAAIPTK